MSQKLILQIKEISQEEQIYETKGKWNSTKEISDAFKVEYQDFDQALRVGYKAQGYFWVYEDKWNRGWRPDPDRQIRNIQIYAYRPIDILKGIEPDNLYYIGRFKNAVECGKSLEISVARIRIVAKGELPVHKKYHFSYKEKIGGEEQIAEIIKYGEGVLLVKKDGIFNESILEGDEFTIVSESQDIVLVKKSYNNKIPINRFNIYLSPTITEQINFDDLFTMIKNEEIVLIAKHEIYK